MDNRIHVSSRPWRAICGILLAGVAFFGGCRQPWYAATDASSDRIAEAGDRLPPERAGRERPSVTARDGQTDPGRGDPFEQPRSENPAGEQAMADLLADLQNSDDIDPATREELIADLRAADPAHWPLIVQQLRTTLAYRRQMAQTEKDSPAADAPEAAAEHHAAPEVAGPEITSGTDRDKRNDSQGASVAARGEAHDIGSAFAADGADADANDPQDVAQAATAEAARTPLPEPEPTEAATATAQADVAGAEPADHVDAAETAEAADRAETGVVAAAFQEPVYQTSANAVTATERTAGSGPPRTDLTWKQLLDMSIARLEEETADAPATSGEIGRHARLRLLHLAADNRAGALAPIEGVPPSQQDFWAKQLFGLSTYLDDAAQPDLRQRAALAQRHLQEATDQLGEIAVLEVQNLTFCSGIRGFGVFDAIARPRFKAGEQVKLYAEVENYRSEPTQEGFRTLLATSYEVLDESDRRVDSGEFPQVEDVCRSRRRDFHIQYGVQLPTRIYGGKYRLQLTIEDMLSRKLGRTSVEFEIVDDRSGAL